MKSEVRHRLYEAAVQTPERDIELIERIARARMGRMPLTLREDFCGTALLSARWVESDDDREAVAVDHDREVLAYAERINRAALEDEADRLTLVHGDVRELSARTFDVIVAMNFSWALFDDRELEVYLASAARCLEDDGLLVLEIFGGGELRRPLVREHSHDDFVYIWEQRAYDAERALLEARIHFRHGESELRDAFVYRFHLRSLERLRAMLREAGLTRVELHVEDRRGRYRRRASEPHAPLWRGLLACSAG